MGSNSNLKQKILGIFMWLVGILFIGILFVTNLTSYEGYSYSYCDTKQVSFVSHAEAHEAFMVNSPDKTRINDLLLVQKALESYKVEKGSFPIADNWSDLEGELVPVYLNELPHDPCVGGGGQTYEYVYKRVSQNMYVLRATLSDTGDRYVIAQHDEDLNGEVYGVWCGEEKYDREFCLSPSPKE